MTEDYKKFTKQFKELQNKFKRFEKSDENRFNEIWIMNENEVRALIQKIIQADRVIHVQQLGIPWTPPSDPIFGFTEAGQGGSQMNPNSSVMDSSKHGMSKSEFVDDQSVATGGDQSKVSITKIKHVFNLLMEEAGFLVDDKAQAECVGKSIKEEFKIKIDAIRKALGIERMDDVDLLVMTFYEFSEENKLEQKRQEEEAAAVESNKEMTSRNNRQKTEERKSDDFP